jgi:hypothetical protein
MAFLIRWKVTEADGTVVHDETVPVETDVLYGFTKTYLVLGQPAQVEITFDPPLQPVPMSE